MFQQDFEASLSAEQQVLLRYRGHAVIAKVEKVLKILNICYNLGKFWRLAYWFSDQSEPGLFWEMVC